MTTDAQTPPPAGSTSLLVLAFAAVAFSGLALGLASHEWLLRNELGIPQGKLQLAQQDFQTGDYRGALTLFTKLADQGDPVAEYWLAHMTELGLGVKQDPTKAIDLYKKAAAQRNVAAQTRIGEIYLDGNIVPPDFESARAYLKDAALQGDARAAMFLGQIYRLGLGAASDPTESYAWFEVATLEHNALAAHERNALLVALSPQQQEAAVARANAIMSAIKNKTALPAKPAPAAQTAQPGKSIPEARDHI
jgi:TPR repeat protein